METDRKKCTLNQAVVNEDSFFELMFKNARELNEQVELLFTSLFFN